MPLEVIIIVVCMDNLEFMKTLNSETIDLIYSDILYGTGKKFKDYQDLKPNKKIIENFYIQRIKEMHRLLKPNGSIYLQCDTRINHWIRNIMDDIFGYDNFQNEIPWCYNTQGYSKTKYSAKHDYLIFYSKSNNFTFNMEDIREEKPSESSIKRYGKEIDKNGFYIDFKSKKKVYELKGSPPLDWINNIPVLAQAKKEKVNYDTQKPLKIMDRIIKASSNKGDTIADFFCGSGSFLVSGKKLDRHIIGCDINPKAIEITNSRLIV